MEHKLQYSFDDEVVSKFCYDVDNRRIEIYLEGFYDLLGERYISQASVWVIEKWSTAKSKLSDESRYVDLRKNLNIISMILAIDVSGNSLKLSVNALDGRYIDLLFEDSHVTLNGI